MARHATDLEVTHWWTSGGEAAAVAEFAKAFDATGNKWVDGAIAGAGSTARPIMISRITGGDPMGATQFNHGRQAEELVEAGLMRDLSDVAAEEKWAEVVNPPSLLESCTLDGKIYCVPVNIHSWQWLWLSNKAFDDAGVAVPTNWAEFVAAAPALEAAGKIPLAMGKQPWQASGAFNVMVLALGGTDLYNKIFVDKDAEAAAGPEMAAIWKAADDARKMAAKSNVQDWNQATNMVITDQAGGQIMGDWAQGEFQVAGEVAGTDYYLPARSRRQRGARHRRRRLLLPADRGRGDLGGAGGAGDGDALARDAGRVQPQEGLAAGTRRRRYRRRQRLHEEGARDRRGRQAPSSAPTS